MDTDRIEGAPTQVVDHQAHPPRSELLDFSDRVCGTFRDPHHRGHWLTKSRAYSTTLTALRAARHQWNLQRDGTGPAGAAVTIGDWRYAGRGWTNDGDAWLAETAARHAADQRRTARQETRTSSTGAAADA